MCEVKKLREILHPSVQVNEMCLSYVDCLFPQFNGSPCIILYKRNPSFIITKSDNGAECEEDEPSQFDLTGSPLKYSFEDENFDETFVVIKRNWRKEEEKYLPLTRIEACKLLNECLEHISGKSPPILALCDSTDNKKTRLLGTIVEDEWFTTIEACCSGTETLSTIKKSPLKFFQEHLKLLPVQEHNVTVSAFTTFDLFGSRAETINWNENQKKNFEGSLSVEVDSSSLSLDPPTRASKNNLAIQLVSGSDISPLRELWKELLLLNQYLSLIEEYKKKTHAQYNPLPLQFPQDFAPPSSEEHDKIIENIHFLLNGDYNYRNFDNVDSGDMNFTTAGNVNLDIKIEQLIKNLPFRSNQDFTDLLWELLTKSTNYLEMTKCIHTVLEEILSGSNITQASLSNTTRFSKLIFNPHSPKLISHVLSGSLPLEYVVDMGVEKLTRDYMYILMNTRIGEIHDIQRKFENMSEEFNVDCYRKRLISMAQIHVCLEFMLLVENNLDCQTENLRPLFLCAFKQYVSEESPLRFHRDLQKNTIYTLRAPVPTSMLNELNKEIPSLWRISLSSATKLSRLTTTIYYSHLPIFPTNIFPSDDSSTAEETYHVTSVICSSNKCKVL